MKSYYIHKSSMSAKQRKTLLPYLDISGIYTYELASIFELAILEDRFSIFMLNTNKFLYSSSILVTPEEFISKVNDCLILGLPMKF